MYSGEMNVMEIRKQNSDIYKAWVRNCSISEDSLKQYKSTIVRFKNEYYSDPLVKIKYEQIREFIDARQLRASTRNNQLNYLKHFFAFIKSNYDCDWDFEIWDIDRLKASKTEIQKTQESAKPLSVKQLIHLYRFFSNHINERKWLETYIIFRLMFDFDLDKYEISSLNEKNFNVETGEYENSTKGIVVFDDEIISVLHEHGIELLPKTENRVYEGLTEIEEIFDGKINITQEVIRITKQNFMIRCPQCGKLIDNNPANFGFVHINYLNLRDLIVCKKCLEEKSELHE